ncbi:hypothetical protein PMZ80_006780 [Knufia obscura]|uniref:Glycosyl transferase CAP10 domain-containing protein n=1 Tax=Knufia obscura TaxID=1635080 RepID=A0ABR0RLL1_9EURO|nr:hypothetical protein PMZ80_006780 [Knufia obscura]
MAGLLGVLCYTVSCLTASILAYSPSSILATDRPVHLAILTLVCSALSLLVIAKRSQFKRNIDSGHRGDYVSIPLKELRDGDAKVAKEKQRIHSYALTSSELFAIVLVATVALTVRVDVQRRLLLVSECATRSVEVWLPFLIAVYDALRFQKRQDVRAIEEDDDDEDLGSTAYQDFAQSLKRSLLSSPWRYVPTAFLLSLGCHLVAGLWLSSESSHVCPISSSDVVVVPRLQWLALLLDTSLAIASLELAIGGMLPSTPILSIPISWAAVLTLSAGVWSIIAAVVIATQPENHAWLFMEHEPSPVGSILSLVCQALLLATFCISTLYSVMNLGLLHISMALLALLTMIPGIRFIWSARRPYPPISSLNLTWSFAIIYLAWSLYSRTRRAMHASESPPSTLRRVIIFAVFALLLYPGLMKSNTVHFHPIDLLMYDAQNKYLGYLNYAASSSNIAEAVHTYQERYQDNPPPGFDVWFEFARNRSVWVTDEFNQIYNDLLPFRAIQPADLRQHTWDMVSNPWNEISGITIRGGVAQVQENVIPTHRWMLEGVVSILESFSQHLPDMDLAFNLNDESRVALPFSDLRRLENKALRTGFGKSASFSTDRASGWKDIPPEPISDTIFENWSFANTFQEWAALTCPSSSAAHRGLSPLFKSQLCLDCAADHSLGQFVSNWSIAADPCHQPDLANLHGFYLSPAAFKATHQLRPVFSQSKVRGFNDILYPSAWNYMDKVAYSPTNTSSADRPAFPDPPYKEKVSSLYWRGATSEGVSTGQGAWRGMTRQRMVHMANNLTMSQHDGVTLLLPDTRHPERYTYTTLPGASLPDIGLATDVSFVDGIARCGGRDCEAQEQEFGSATPDDFQSHWKYKYLIDLDGAGFSGRFLPFLQSHSLPLKAALFREWYDSRLIPWLHFVPLDLRLHGLWSTLAYFAGVHGTDADGRTWDWNGHQREAELIAESGREWSRKVLTKADMEVYFFRLLLEWGRLTDDRRDELGFVL